MDDSVDNYGFLADHALPQYFTIIIIIIIIIFFIIYLFFFSLRPKQNVFLWFGGWSALKWYLKSCWKCYNLVDLICTLLYLHLNMSKKVVAEFTI